MTNTPSRPNTYHLAAYHGGLGDWLQFSTLPETLSAFGHKVHLWENAQFRNPQVKELIMLNPYILPPVPGGGWNLGDTPDVPYRNTERAFIMNWEAAFGLPPENWLPKIYYDPIPTFGKLGGIIELSGISLKYDPATVIARISDLVALRDDVSWHQLISPHQVNPICIPGVPELKIGGIFELCDAIANCDIFVSLQSGSNSVAAAMQRINPHFEQYCLLPAKDVKWIMESRKFVYPNVEHIVS